MSKKNRNFTNRTVNGYNIGQYPHWAVQDLEGKILTLLEGLNLPEKQENAVKSLVRNIIWDHWNGLDKITKEFDIIGSPSVTNSN